MAKRNNSFEFCVEKESFYFKYSVGKSIGLVLAFSYFGMPSGKFSLNGVFNNSSFDVLFLKCENDLFYLNGIPGLGGVEESVSVISELVRHYEVRDIKTISIGSSMGANGALQYGVLCGTDYIFCSGLREDIQNLSNTFRKNKYACDVKEYVPYSSLLDSYDGKAYLCCGDHEVSVDSQNNWRPLIIITSGSSTVLSLMAGCGGPNTVGEGIRCFF